MAQLIPSPEQLRSLRDAFNELKAEQDQMLRQRQYRTFVHTKVYQQVKEEGRCLLIGRKGSGKTAMLVGYRAENKEDYLTHADIEIIADEFPLEPLFTFFTWTSANAWKEKGRAKQIWPLFWIRPA